MRKYFGTDGIRGEANRELTVDIALKLGYALGYYLKQKKGNGKIKVIMGSDTRRSGYMLRSALTAGLNSMGVDIDFVGVISTPAVAHITKTKGADAGIMISASHNPAKDNGLKVFGPNGYKLPDETEAEIERLMDDYLEITKNAIAGDEVGRFKYAEDEYTVTATSPEYTWENFPSGTYTVNVQAVPAEPDKFDNSMIVGTSVTVAAPALTNMTSGTLTQDDFRFISAVVGTDKLAKGHVITYKNFMFTENKGDKVSFGVDSNFGAYYSTGGSSSVKADAAEASQTIRFLAAGAGKLTVVATSTSTLDPEKPRRVSYGINGTKSDVLYEVPGKPSGALDPETSTFSFDISAAAGDAIDIYGDANIYVMNVTWEPSGQLPPVAGLTPVTEATTWGSDVWNEFYSHRTDQAVEYGSDFTIDKDYYVINNLMIYPTAGQKIRVSETSSGSGTYYLQLQGGDGSYPDGPSADATDEQLQGYTKNFIRFRANGKGTLTLTARHTSGTAGSGRFVCVAVGGSADAVGVGTIQPTRFDAAQHTSFTEQSWDITASNGDAITIVVTNSLRIGEITWTPAQ